MIRHEVENPTMSSKQIRIHAMKKAASSDRGEDADRNETTAESEQELWAFKRQRQALDLRSVSAGRQPAAAMSWFAGGKAKAAKLVDSSY
jgi:hypothetical protein